MYYFLALKKNNRRNWKNIKHFLVIQRVCLSRILEGESCFSKSFHAVPESVEFLLSADGELPEL